MNVHIIGMHHVTAIASYPQRNLDFYSSVLGLHLVKLTVNFDDPGSYHFYFGDEIGRPGSILTFFPWPGSRAGRRGTGQAAQVSFRVGPGALPYWQDRLVRHEVTVDRPAERFNEPLLSFMDPDGLLVELIERDDNDGPDPWQEGIVEAEYAIRGLHSVTLFERNAARTAEFLTEVLGFQAGESKGSRGRFLSSRMGAGNSIDVVDMPSVPAGLTGAGTVHHVALRAETAEQQLEWRSRIIDAGLTVTPVLDRQYFQSIYFREPGGTLFEIATDLPGFAIDEPAAGLGMELKLPPWLEAQRAEIVNELPRLRLPNKEMTQGSETPEA
jgi:glyoxalase family protein